MANKIYFSQNILYLRKLHNLTQEQFGKKIGKKGSTIACWENELRQPTTEDANNVAKAFGVTLGDLVCKDLSISQNNQEQEKVLSLYNSLNSKQKEAVLNMMVALNGNL